MLVIDLLRHPESSLVALLQKLKFQQNLVHGHGYLDKCADINDLWAEEAVAARHWSTHVNLATCAPSSTSNVSGTFSTVAVRCAKLLASAADGANWKAAFARSLGAAASAPSSSQCKSYMLSPWQRRSKKLSAILTNGEDMQSPWKKGQFS